MLKRPATTHKATRKRRKGGTIYPITKFDLPQGNQVVEEKVHVSDFSTSGAMGRVSVNRRTVKHRHQASSKPEELATSEQLELTEEVNAEEAGTRADPDAPANAEECCAQKTARANKENDSVSEIIYLRLCFAHPRP